MPRDALQPAPAVERTMAVRMATCGIAVFTGEITMSGSAFRTVAAVIFGIVALGHAARLALSVPIQVGSTAIPLWASWLGLVVAGALCVWGFRSRS